MTGIVKEFPGVRALDGVDLDVRPGEVHALLGQNGAGQVDVDQGARRRAPARRGHDHLARRAGPAEPPARGDAARHRHDLPGARPGRRPLRRRERLPRPRAQQRRVHPPGATRAAARDLLRRLGHSDIPADREVGRLSAAGKQIVSMARALSHDARLIVMDEPSAVLDSGEVGQPVPGHPRPHRRRGRGRLHLAPPRGDPRDRRPGHRAQGRPHRRHRPAGGRHPDRRADHG